MEEWLGQVAQNLGVDKELVRLAVGHVFGFLQQRHPQGPADELICNFPGAEEAVASAAAAPQKGVSGIIGKIGGTVGGAKGDLVVLTTRLASMGLSAEQLQKLAQAIFGQAELVIGRAKLQTMTDEIPGLSSFLWPQKS
jgi:hypothetical protein